MKKLLILLSLVYLSSCSFEGARNPASEISSYERHSGQIEVRLSEEAALSDKEGFSEELYAKIKRMNKNFEAAGSGYSVDLRSMQVRIKYVDDLPENTAYVLDTKVDELGNHIIQIYGSKKATVDMTAQDEIMGILSKIVDKDLYPNPFGFFETSLNARAGHKQAQLHLQNIHLDVIEDIQEEISGEPLDEKVSQIQESISELESAIKVAKKEAKAQEASRKDVMKVLDKAAADGQLKNLLQANDREGVASLLEKYIPREQMTPMEHKFWDFTLNKIRNPVALKDRVLMYRGTDGDRLYPMIKDGVELSKEEAVKQGKLGAMSTILTRNQGTWNRRLRSLQTMYGKEFSQNPQNPNSKFVETARLTTWMKQHADDPMGSPFLSFSSSYDVAYRFGKESLGAFLVDPEVIVFNQMTDYKSEMEFLHTLISFPDEMFSYYDSEFDGKLSGDSIRAKIDADLKKVLKEEYGEQSDKIYQDLVSKSKEFVDSKRAFLVPEKKLETVTVQTNKRPGLWRRFWNWVKRKDEPYYVVENKTQEVKAGPNKLTCSYALMSFLKY
ncbi:hypothetical protein [Bacteriovorax sp. DB6_IX]|uniref:hypothetical protein n=1 Tax=Bacteriovorax sp. DB6_IX TaxID=1353530 RepID=UPI00038A2C25|nr:hypothetical protein [Bacteriovorax sp. DB6_IX]EQC50858.1 hypothetical protein M901_2272 [Bacteriovorax sp. DB6_IX]